MSAYILVVRFFYDIINGKRLFESNDKFYFEEQGLRNTQAEGIRNGNIEKVVENLMTPGVTRNYVNGIIHLNLRNFLMLGSLD